MASSGASRGSSAPTVSTPAAGVALANGTPTFVTLTSPNDGKLHLYEIAASLNVTVAETGGQVQYQFTINGLTNFVNLYNGGSGINTIQASAVILCDPNTTVAVAQSTALTAGAATIFVGISGG